MPHGMYYSVGTAADPAIELVVSTWVYVKKSSNDYCFCEWNDYVLSKDKKDLDLYKYRPEPDEHTGEMEFPGLCTKADLLELIEISLLDDDDNDRAV
mgnify:FL=1